MQALKPSFIWNNHKIRLSIIFTVTFGLGEISFRVVLLTGFGKTFASILLPSVYLICLLGFAAHFIRATISFLNKTKKIKSQYDEGFARSSSANVLPVGHGAKVSKKLYALSRHVSWWLMLYAMLTLGCIVFVPLNATFFNRNEAYTRSAYDGVVVTWVAFILVQLFATSRIMAMRGVIENTGLSSWPCKLFSKCPMSSIQKTDGLKSSTGRLKG